MPEVRQGQVEGVLVRKEGRGQVYRLCSVTIILCDCAQVNSLPWNSVLT